MTKLDDSPDRPPGRRELLAGIAGGVLLLWINFYISRDFFSAQTAYMNSMQGFWIALAKHAGGAWFRPTWWPYWDCGMPFEAAYAPLVPALTAAMAALRHVTHAMALASVSGVVYCLAPLSLYLMVWGLMRRPGYAFSAALFYSLTSPSQILAPDGDFAFSKFWDARRLFMLAAWDDTPHVAALSLLPLMTLALVLAMRRRRLIWCGVAAVLMALMTTASVFGPVLIAIVVVCLLATMDGDARTRNLALVLGVGGYAYAMAAAFVPPSLVLAIREAAATRNEERWTLGSLTALLLLAAGWTLLRHFLGRWTRDWRLQFFVLFAYVTSAVPMIAVHLHRFFLPQPTRYCFEMEMGVALLVPLAAGACLDRLPAATRRVIILLLLTVSAEQVISYRQREKDLLFPRDITQTVEYRAAIWTGQNLPGERVFLPGSVGQWADAFAPVQQFAGGSWSVATNQSQQKGNAAMMFYGGTAAEDARLSLTWLKAYGVSAAGTSSADSKEYWHAFTHPGKFDGLLPVLWSQDGVTIYRVPQRSPSLAHLVPEATIVRHEPRSVADVSEVERYVAALDDSALPLADFEWDGPNRAHIRLAAGRPGQDQVVSIQVGYHGGWHATTGGHTRAIYRDGLGLMWLRPACAGSCEIQLDYDGGWGLGLCRVISYAAIAGLLLLPWFGRRGKKRLAEERPPGQSEG